VVTVCHTSSTNDEAFGERDMAGKFEIKNKPGGHYHFVLKAVNGEIIATSETYTTKAAAKYGIESVKSNAASAPVVDLTGE
jgi:uncharacterized protein